MDQQFNSSSGLHLPQPSVGQGSFPDGTNLQATSNVSTQASPTVPLPSGLSNSQIQAASPQAGDQADDLDKEWVAKAKSIVEQTKHDPYLQSKEIGRAKADYLRIRFNKHIKLGPEQTP